MNRAKRRFHSQRMKNKAILLSKIYEIPNLKYISDHLKACSCSMCGNPRKYFNEKTLQEKKSDLDFEEFKNGLQMNEDGK